MKTNFSKRILKKSLLPISLSTMILASGSIEPLNVNAVENVLANHKSNVNFVSKRITNWSENKTNTTQSLNLKFFSNKKSLLTEEENVGFYHNDGNPIATNIISDNKDDVNLFAIIEYNVGSTSYRDYYFSEQSYMDLDEIKEDSSKDLSSMPNQSAPTLAKVSPMVDYEEASAPYIRTYNWSFESPTSGKVNSKVKSTVVLARKTSKATIDGAPGSVWNVTTENYLSNTIINPPFIEWNARLAVPYANEDLISYGPKDSGGGSVDVSLSGYVPAISYSFEVGGFSVNDSSNVFEKYGRWSLRKNLFNITPDSASMSPAIRVINKKGSLATQISHSYIRSGGESHYTGVVEIVVPDR
ncbi:hypothetical protein ACQKJC_24650 [Priestia koreensis]|uniref:hypothetical protein n=1 Tax=Priestia koreensis TaxID=284581 RepID=UPI003D011DE3